MKGVKIVRASAGSGKTYNLTYEYVRNVIIDPERYKHILAVTFTNKATEEMKARILKYINSLAVGEKANGMLLMLIKDTGYDENIISKRAKVVRNYILHDYSNFYVLTIDKFFQRVIRAFIREIGIDINFNLELQTDSILETAADKLIDDMVDDKILREWIFDFIGENISVSNKWNIKEGLVALGKEIFKDGAEQKNTSVDFKSELKKIVFQSYIRAEQAKKNNINAAENFISFLNNKSLDIMDLYGGRNGIAGYVQKIIDGGTPNVSSYVNKALNEGIWCSKKSANSELINNVSSDLHDLLKNIVDTQRVSISADNDSYLLSEHYRNFALIIDLRKKIDSLCVQERIIPISDINKIISDLISGNEAPFIFEKMGTRFTHYMIDEFQDTSTVQWNNFLPLLKNAEAQSDDTAVLLVGDVKQSIYRWRGGDWSLLSGKAEKEFNEPQVRFLKDNYRSSHNIVRFNNALIENCADILNDDVNSRLEQASESNSVSKKFKDYYHDIIKTAYEDCVQNPVSEDKTGYASVIKYNPETILADENPVIQTVNDLLNRGFRPCDIAILVRKKDFACAVAELLLDYKKRNRDKITYDIVTQEALVLGNSDICSFVISCMGLAVSPENSIYKAVYNHWQGREFEVGLSEDEIIFFKNISLKSPQEAFEDIAIRFEFERYEEHAAYIQAMHDRIIDFCRTQIADIRLFMSWWEEESDKISIEMPQSDNAITISTIHKAKGLEYKAVIIPYCDWSLVTIRNSVIWAKPKNKINNSISSFPVGYVAKMADSSFSESFFEETLMAYIDNLNILYVAITRAIKELYMIIPNAKRQFSQRIGNVVDKAFKINGETVSIGKMQGVIEETTSGIKYNFGIKENIDSYEMTQKDVMRIHFSTFVPKEKISIKYSLDRYYGENDSKLNQRDLGILMHKVFEQSSDYNDIERAILSLKNNGEIDSDEAIELQQYITESFKNDMIAGWFSNKWKHIYTEKGILYLNGKELRPDRVMVNDDETVIVDYKFGLVEKASYNDQVKLYMRILEQIGYKNIKGYIWYISKQVIVEV